MKNLFFVFLLLFPLISSAQQFDIETTKGTASFTYFDGTEGTFSGVSAVVHFDLSDLSKGSVSGTVNVSTLDTKNKLRNKHLKEKKYFDAENYPTMSFESSSISEKDGVFTIKGNLTIKNTTKEVIFKAGTEDDKLLLVTYIYGLDFDVAVSKKREKTGIEVYVTLPI
jgi:polyisoprenoid-binding protein YceI